MVGPDVSTAPEIARPLRVTPSVAPLDLGGPPPGGEAPPLLFAGLRWPPPGEEQGGGAQGWKTLPATPFRDADWDLDKFVIAMTAEFALHSKGAWGAILDPASDDDRWQHLDTEAELRELRALIEYRSGVIDEAMAQRAGLLTYLRGVVNFRASSHPATYALCAVAIALAQLQDMHWKNVFRRPRPSRLDPRLVPPIEVPGHGAFPSGHACEAMTAALVLEQVLPPAVVDFRPAGGGQPAACHGAEAGPLRAMARRIARNREVLGVHYPSDTVCGFKVAARGLPFILGIPSLRGVPNRARGRATEGFRATQPLRLANGREEPVALAGGVHATGLLARARAEWV